MNLETQVMQKLKQAMLAKDEGALRGLRAIKAAILLEKTAKGKDKQLSEETEIKILQKLAKQRTESLQIYKQQHRTDLVQKEQEELVIIQRFLPKEMDVKDIETIVRNTIQDHQANSMADMGKIMGAVMKKLSGKANNKTISKIVKKELSS